MKHVKLFEQFIKESRRVNESTGADLLRLLDDALSGGVEFQTIYDMKKEDQPPSRELKAAAKKIGGGDDNVAVIYSQMTDNWDSVLKTAREWSRAGGKYVEVEDEDGSAIVFSLTESRRVNEANTNFVELIIEVQPSNIRFYNENLSRFTSVKKSLSSIPNLEISNANTLGFGFGDKYYGAAAIAIENYGELKDSVKEEIFKVLATKKFFIDIKVLALDKNETKHVLKDAGSTNYTI
jgi:hypothetical protein